jgi:hypothetical protein
MIAGSSGRNAAVTARDHDFRTESVSDDETKAGRGRQTAAAGEPLWQTASMTFGRIIIGWRVGT